MICSPSIRYPEPPDFRGKNVLIVGGTHGAGEAVAWRVIRGLASVTVVGLTKNEQLPCKQIIMDVVSNPSKVEQYFQETDYVFNTIGMVWRGLIVNTPRMMVQSFLKTNVEIMFLLTKYALQHTSDVVVNMSSRPVFSTNKSWSLYASTKHAIIDITRAADEEGKQKFYAFCPSRMDTKFRDYMCPNEDRNTRLTPDEAAGAVVALFNGKNKTGHYWLRRKYDGANSRGF